MDFTRQHVQIGVPQSLYAAEIFLNAFERQQHHADFTAPREQNHLDGRAAAGAVIFNHPPSVLQGNIIVNYQ
jgi:hypothetical protein